MAPMARSPNRMVEKGVKEGPSSIFLSTKEFV